MKRVIKQAEPAAFIDWKAKANEDWQPGYRILRNPEKRALHEALLAEQGQVCCYCGRSVNVEDSHIEHFRPQEPYEQLALDYGNLYASCIREASPGAPLHCGHAKDGTFDEAHVISPQDAEAERRFIYSRSDGSIYPTSKNDAPAQYMSNLLRLNISFLRDRRAEVLKAVFDDAFTASASEGDFTRLARAYRQPDGSGCLTSFGHVLSRYAEQLLGRSLLP